MYLQDAAFVKLQKAATAGIVWASEMAFGENLRRLRSEAGYDTATALAKALGVSTNVISRWETGATGPPAARTLATLAVRLDCRVDALLDGTFGFHARDLPCQPPAADSSASEASPHVSAPARLLERERAQHRETVTALEGIVDQLVALIERSAEAGAPHSQPAPRRRHRRTAHR